MLLKLQLVHSPKQTSHCRHQCSRTSCSLKLSYKMVMIQMLVLIIMLPQTSKDPRKLMKLIYRRLGMMVLPQMVLMKHKAVIILSTSPLLSFPKLKVCELKAILSKCGQSTNGLKAVLLDCLKNALEQHLPVLSSARQAAHLTDDLRGFSANARWKGLEPIETAVEEPQNVVPYDCSNNPHK